MSLIEINTSPMDVNITARARPEKSTSMHIILEGDAGGFPEPGFPLPDRIYSSYVYRDTFELPNKRPAWLHTDDPSEAFSADQVSWN
ncbi:MAG: hypothetical protein MK132_11725 [Lentisphaerales bacterium]|nr:hypothetical protein [Lentisphaerales bacterium]